MSAPQTLTQDRITVDRQLYRFVEGRAGEECPRKGYSVLNRKFQKPLLIETRCKQKRCKPCSPAVRAHVSLKAEIGAWIRGASSFITLTFKMGTGLQKDADSVQVAWRRFLYLLKRNYPELTEKMHWLKVIELTQRGQPHLHLIVTGLPGGMQDRCRGRKNEKNWVLNGCFKATGTCLLHAVAKTWLETTKGESWVCDASKVRSAAGAGNYVAKYITKAYGDRRFEKLGFKRVWSASQGFAPDLRVRLAGTVAGKWTKVEHFHSKYSQSDWLDRSDGDPDLERVGHPLVMEKIAKRELKRKLRELEDLQRGFANNQQAIDLKVGNVKLGSRNSVRAYAARN